MSASPVTAGGRALVSSSALLAVGLAVGQLLAYALNVVGARVLGPEGYGELGTLLGLVVLGNVVSLAVQAVTARRVSTGSPAPALAGTAASAATAEVALALVLVPVLAAVLDLGLIPLVAVAVAFLPLTLTGWAIGAAQGQQRFAALSAQYALAAGLRIGGALLALVVTGDIAWTAAGMLAGTVAAWFAVRPLGRVPSPVTLRPDGDSARETGRAALALLAMFALTSVDVLLARALQDPAQAGQYAAGAILTKIAFWLPHAVVVAAYPRLSAGEPGALRRAVMLLVALGAAGVAGAVLLGPSVVPVVLGDDYPVVATSAGVFVLAGVLQSLAYLVVYDRLATDDRRTAALVWGSVAVLVLLAATVGRSSPVSLAWCVAASATLLTLAGASVRRTRADSTRATSGTGADQ